MESSRKIKKIAVVSGATGYLGSEVVRQLAVEDFSVALIYHGASEETVKEQISHLAGGGHRAYICNLQNEEEVARTIRIIEEDMGQIYAAVHTAGTSLVHKKLFQTSGQELHEQFELNVFGSFYFLRSCALRMKEYKQGILIGITTAGVVTQKNTTLRGAYGVAKFAVHGMLAALKEELEQFGVQVYAIAPGFMDGGMNASFPRAFVELVLRSSPSGKITNAIEVAEKITSLCIHGPSTSTPFNILLAPETLSE